MRNILKKYFIVFTLSLLALGLLPAKPTTAKTESKPFELPTTAKRISPTLYYLGHAKDSGGRDVQGYAFVHRKDGEAKGGKKPPKSGGSACYGYLANGAKWKTQENWVMNPSNPYGLNGNTLFTTQSSDIAKWETAAADNSIIGNGSLTNASLQADTGSPDNLNEVYFGAIADSNTIGVTIVWGIFYGPPQTRELVEWDQVYNTYYDWSLSGEAGKMDFENISTHELGHTFGMDDIYDSSCTDVTMFGYADFGDINKRTLEQPDVTGVHSLYN